MQSVDRSFLCRCGAYTRQLACWIDTVSTQSFYHSAIENLRCRRHSIFGHACLWVRLCVPKTLWTPYLKNHWREFHPILVTYVLWFTDVLVRFWGQKVKGQGHSRRRHNSRSSSIYSYVDESLFTGSKASMSKHVTCSNSLLGRSPVHRDIVFTSSTALRIIQHAVYIEVWPLVRVGVGPFADFHK